MKTLVQEFQVHGRNIHIYAQKKTARGNFAGWKHFVEADGGYASSRCSYSLDELAARDTAYVHFLKEHGAALAKAVLAKRDAVRAECAAAD